MINNCLYYYYAHWPSLCPEARVPLLGDSDSQSPKNGLFLWSGLRSLQTTLAAHGVGWLVVTVTSFYFYKPRGASPRRDYAVTRIVWYYFST